jgi:hypothetical protein
MYIYSKTTALFLKRAKQLTKTILSEEMGILVHKTRFELKKILYPINLVVFERKNILGFFDPHGHQIGLSKRLIFEAKETLIKNIIRHELAHFLTYIESTTLDHGPLFKETCQRFSWDKKIQLAAIDLSKENEKFEGDLKAERLISKIQKLLSLASSSNPHEAKMATLKANELMINHNLDKLENFSNQNEEEETSVVRILKGKKNSAKYHTIYEILKLFMVQPVFNYGKEGFYLEVVGEKINVEIANYVGSYLDLELDRLWECQKKSTPHLKGIAKKNSFMRGLSKGYLEKINLGKKSLKINPKALTAMEKSLESKVKRVYPRLAHTKSKSGVTCSESEKVGQKSGRRLFIPRALSGESKKRPSLIYTPS